MEASGALVLQALALPPASGEPALSLSKGVGGVVELATVAVEPRLSEPEPATTLARSLLAPGGLLLNADLVVPPGQDNPDKPGRRTVARHLELLHSHGYERVACTLEQGEFGCVVGFSPLSSPAASQDT